MCFSSLFETQNWPIVSPVTMFAHEGYTQVCKKATLCSWWKDYVAKLLILISVVSVKKNTNTIDKEIEHLVTILNFYENAALNVLKNLL